MADKYSNKGASRGKNIELLDSRRGIVGKTVAFDTTNLWLESQKDENNENDAITFKN